MQFGCGVGPVRFVVCNMSDLQCCCGDSPTRFQNCDVTGQSVGSADSPHMFVVNLIKTNYTILSYYNNAKLLRGNQRDSSRCQVETLERVGRDIVVLSFSF